MTASGSMGSPSEATPEKGKALLDGVVDEVAKFIVDFSRWPKLPKIGPR
jgi:creatinine amidohydrolase/Fe(II)-dependent formamide hydrolase-like protein